MDVVTLLESAMADGVSLRAVEGELQMEAPANKRCWLERLRPHKADILRHLTGADAAEPADTWPELERLDADNLPAFPVDTLPDAIAEWVAAEAHATQTPADLPGLLALAMVAAGIATNVDIQPDPRNHKWREPSNVYVAVLLDPGNRKSAVFADAKRPLDDAEHELRDAARPAWAREQSERRQAEKRLAVLERKSAEKGDRAAATEAGELAERLAEWPDPMLPKLIVDDCTAERLAVLLAAGGGRLASMGAEGGVFDLMAGKYAKGGAADFALYLQAHAGDPLRVDRVGRPEVRCERPALTCAYAVQPDVIAGLARTPAFRRRGLLGRFLFAKPRSLLGGRLVNPGPMPDAVADRYAEIVRCLATDPPRATLILQPDAAHEFREWQQAVELMLGDGGELESMTDWGGKLVGATARMAAILHAASYARRPMPDRIDAGTVRAAIRIGRYLIPHADAVLCGLAGAGVVDDARYVLRWILRHVQHEFRRTDAYQAGRRRFETPDDIDPALVELERRGYIRPQSHGPTGPGRPPSPTYSVNPAVFESAQKRTGNTENSVPSVELGNSQDLQYASDHEAGGERERVTI